MERLILLRHAKSAYPSGVADHDRPLSDRGIRDGRTIADHLEPFLPERAVVSAAVSTAVRAQQTWALTSSRLTVRHWSDRSLYLASADQLWDVVPAFDTDIGIIVGHNPGLEDLAGRFQGADGAVDAATGARMSDKFPTSAFAVLDCPTRDWRPEAVTCVGFTICR